MYCFVFKKKKTQNKTGSMGGDKADTSISGYGVTGPGYSASPLQGATSTTSNQQTPGAPPLNRLVDIINTKPSVSSPSASSTTSSMTTAGVESTLSPYMGSSARLNSPPSPTQIDPFYTQANDSMQPLDDTWVTVFGHPPSATSFVLQEFATYGQIVRYVPPGHTEQGNWLHIKYQTRMQAQKALSKNGKILGGQFMVGVMACIDRKVMFGQAGVAQSPSTTFSKDEENAEPVSGANKAGLPNRIGFSNASRLDRTQSLRAGTRPLTNLNRPSTHDDSSIDVILYFLFPTFIHKYHYIS